MTEGKYSHEGVHRMMYALVEIIADQSDEIEVLKNHAEVFKRSLDHSCDLIDRQIAALLKLASEHGMLPASNIHGAFITDPADE